MKQVNFENRLNKIRTSITKEVVKVLNKNNCYITFPAETEINVDGFFIASAVQFNGDGQPEIIGEGMAGVMYTDWKELSTETMLFLYNLITTNGNV